MYPEHAEAVLAWLQSQLAVRWVEQGHLIPTQIVDYSPNAGATLEHEQIVFPSYPWEWTPGQWKLAAKLTLDLCEEALESGYILKDATPLNILFRGPEPVFVDVLSFELRDRANPIWIAYGQFVRTFLLPLAACKYLGWPLAAFQCRRDGYEPQDLAPWLSWQQRWRQPIRSLVTLPLLLQKSFLMKSVTPKANRPAQKLGEISGLLLRRTLQKTRRLLNALDLKLPPSQWGEYAHTASHYCGQDHEDKQLFVRRWLHSIRPATVLDVGANTGVYSRIAAAAGARVIAWDTDIQACETNWQTAREANLSILPLVADFARPTPPIGWENAEYSSLAARAKERFDCVLMLGILHHLLLADQIPLPAIVEQLAEMTTGWAILEWVPQEDDLFHNLLRGRNQLYGHLNEEFFRQVLSQRFLVHDRTRLSNGRSLYAAEKIG